MLSSNFPTMCCLSFKHTILRYFPICLCKSHLNLPVHILIMLQHTSIINNAKMSITYVSRFSDLVTRGQEANFCENITESATFIIDVTIKICLWNVIVCNNNNITGTEYCCWTSKFYSICHKLWLCLFHIPLSCKQLIIGYSFYLWLHFPAKSNYLGCVK